MVKEVNYITHLNSMFLVFYHDDRLKSAHMALYTSLFYYWNLHHFSQGFYINRKEVMKMSKIGSKSTYHRLISDLHRWQYLSYYPTKNPYEKSRVELSQICTSSSTKIGQAGTLLKRYRPKNGQVSLYNKQYKLLTKGEAPLPKDKNEVISFFKLKGKSELEAIKFFNYYQGTDWYLNSNLKIKNWQPIAENWMLKQLHTPTAIKQQKAASIDYLQTSNSKNYEEPL